MQGTTIFVNIKIVYLQYSTEIVWDAQIPHHFLSHLPEAMKMEYI